MEDCNSDREIRIVNVEVLVVLRLILFKDVWECMIESFV